MKTIVCFRFPIFSKFLCLFSFPKTGLDRRLNLTGFYERISEFIGIHDGECIEGCPGEMVSGRGVYFSKIIKNENETNFCNGFFVYSDPAMKQFLLHLEERNELGKRFIIQVRCNSAWRLCSNSLIYLIYLIY